MSDGITVRPAAPADAEACGRVIYDAFVCIADAHRFPHDFPSVEATTRLARMMTGHPACFGVVAESGGKIIGCNFLDERDAIRGVGPMTVDPAFHGQGIGRRLMQAVIDRGRGAAGIRLVQDAFNTVSMSLYTSLGKTKGVTTDSMIAFPRTMSEGLERIPCRLLGPWALSFP